MIALCGIKKGAIPRLDECLLRGTGKTVLKDLVWRKAGRLKLVKPPLARRCQKGQICVY
jgi:hypothetical protein